MEKYNKNGHGTKNDDNKSKIVAGDAKTKNKSAECQYVTIVARNNNHNERE